MALILPHVLKFETHFLSLVFKLELEVEKFGSRLSVL